MEDNFALRYVIKHPGINSRAELVPARAYARNGASRRWLGDVTIILIWLLFKYFLRVSDNFDQNDLSDLKSELKILTHVGENENIVNILGACTKG
jgi:hypothetical protein